MPGRGAMKSLGRIAIPVFCVAVICGAAISWRAYKAKANARKLAEAASLYRARAEQGDATAQSDLGHKYYEGKDVAQDYAEAVRWYRKAADQGYAEAQCDLAGLYYQGKGVPQDYTEAARWYRKAAIQGDEYARRALDSMKIGFTAQGKICLSGAFLGSIVLLISSRVSMRNRQQRRATLAGLLGLSWVGLDVYGYSHFGILQSLSAVNAFFFGKSISSGIWVAMFFSIVWPQGFKVVLRICGILFIGFNVYAITHYHSRHLAACPRAFYSGNGLLIGMAIPMAILLWLARKPEGVRTA